MKKGAAVLIRIDDTEKLFTKHEGRSPNAHLLLAVRTAGGMLRIATSVSRDEAGRTQQLVIPFDTPSRILVASPLFRILDASRTALTGRDRALDGMSVTVPAAQRSATIRLTLAGVN